MLGMDGGLDFHGEWFNKRTGEKVTVKQAIQDGQNMKIILMNGQQIDMQVFSQNYLQVTDDIYDESGKKISSAPVQSSEVKIQPKKINNVPKVKSLDEPLFSEDVEVIKPDQPIINTQHKSEKSNTKFDIIDKILKVNRPNINVILEWEKPPIAELKMLNTYFDIKASDIADYIKSTVTIDDLYISEQINNLLEKN